MNAPPRHPGFPMALRLEEISDGQQVILFDTHRGVRGIYVIAGEPFIGGGYESLSIKLTHHTGRFVSQHCVSDLGLCSYDEHQGLHQQDFGWPSWQILVSVDNWESLPIQEWMKRLTLRQMFEL